jgi:hypothetical protein
MKKKYICPYKDECSIGNCSHSVPHEHQKSCDNGICTLLSKYISCIPIEFIEEDEFIIL